MRREYNVGGGAESYVIIDNTASASNPATKITGFPGKDFDNDIRWIRENSHLYTGELVNGVLQCIQLSDTDKTKYVYGNPAPITTKDVFMKLPEFWWKCSETSSGGDKWKLYFSKRSKSNWNHWEGNTFIAVYKAYNSSNKVYSYSEKTPTVNVSQSNFKSYARARGNGYQIVTYEAHQIMCLLFYAYYGNTNSQLICGSGNSSYPKTTGKSNSLGMTDTTTSNSSSLQTVNFWGLENWWGDIYEWIDNLVTASNYKINVQNINNTTIRTINTGLSSNGDSCIKQMVFNTNGDTVPKSFYSNINYNTYYADYGKVGSSTDCVALRSNYANYSSGGVCFLDVNSTPSYTYSRIGSRLQYKGNYVILMENGVFIGYTDGSISPYNQSPISGKTVKGVVLKTDKVSICIHKTTGYGKKWSADSSIQISGVTTTTDRSKATLDFKGKTNTDAVIASGLAGSAFTFATNIGSEWYLPACGEMEEIRYNVTNINIAISNIGGTKLNFDEEFYWCSTQSEKSGAWCWAYGTHYWMSTYKNSSNAQCRAVCAF